MIRVTDVESATKGGGGGDLVAGETDVKVHSAEPHTSRGTGNQSIHLTLRTRDGDFIHEYVKPEGWRISLLCATFGLAWEPGEEFNEEALVGLYGRVLTKVEPGQGDWPAKLRVARWLKPGESAPKPAVPTRAARSGTATPPREIKAPAKAAAVRPPEDDPPF